MSFRQEPVPERGIATEILPGVWRMVAENPGPMTNHGTNTYLLPHANGWDLIDPGPDTDLHHAEALLRHTQGQIRYILLTHAHADHFGLIDWLKARSAAQLCSYHTPLNGAVMPDVALDDGESFLGMEVIHTPGHAPDHLCFARPGGEVFTGDHVMAWSSTVVSPPHGSMAGYIDSLSRLIARQDQIYLPGHGPALPEPAPHMTRLRDRRIEREGAILTALAEGLSHPAEIADTLYGKTDPVLKFAAERNVCSHLLKLQADGQAIFQDDAWRIAP